MINFLEVPTNFESFAKEACECCKEEWYCPSHCVFLEKAKKIPFELIMRSYIRNEGDFTKVARFIRRKKL